MLKWVSKLWGADGPQPPPGVPADWLAALQALLQQTEHELGRLASPQAPPQHAGLADELLAHVLHGALPAGQALPARLAQLPDLAAVLGLAGWHPVGSEQTALRPVMDGLGRVPPAVGLRWARVLEASVQGHLHSCRLQLPRGVHWPELVLLAGAGLTLGSWPGQLPTVRGTTCALLESLLVEDGLPASALITASFATPVDSGYGTSQRLQLLCGLPDYPQALERHLHELRPHLLPASVAQRLHVLAMLQRATPASLEALAPVLAELAVAASRQVRTEAEPLLRRCGGPGRAALRELAMHGKPEQRQHALRLLHASGVAAEQDFARRTAAADKAPSVQALLAAWDAQDRPPADGPDAASAQPVALPRIDWSATACRLPDGALERLWAEIDASIAQSNAMIRQHHERAAAQGQTYPLRLNPPFTPADASALQAYLASGQARPPKALPALGRGWNHAAAAVHTLAGLDGVQPVAVMKLLLFFDIATNDDGLLMYPAIRAFEVLHRRLGRPTLLELSCMMDDAGLDGRALLRNYCHAWGAGFAVDWPDEQVWPYVAHQVDALVQLLQSGGKDHRLDRQRLYQALALLPQPPASAVEALFAVALGAAKTEHAAAQHALRRLPDKEARIIAALSAGKADTRAVAAAWLARLRTPAALPALEAAVVKEKHDGAKGAMLDALQALGRPVDRYLDRHAITAEAVQALAKGLPPELQAFPWAALPAVRWADDGSAVPQALLRWLLVQAVRQKSPEPGAVLRKLCGLFEPRDREAFGQFVLETWLQDDVRPILADEALALARREAQLPPVYHRPALAALSLEERTLAYLPALQRRPAGSAIASKGLLAVAAACAGERAAAPVARYLKEWYGTRAAQGKALIAMLAWIEHPSATQLMLAIGSRFRTKGFQDEATRQAEALAERKGWTVAELADRTVPTAGFDETGLLALPYGERSFSARLLPDLKIELLNPEGRKIAALPEPRQDDDAQQAEASKKALAQARKELKSIVELQTDRLYEALCTERDWPAADWSSYLLQHPVLRHLVQRLVWVEQSPEPAQGTGPDAELGQQPNGARDRVPAGTVLPRCFRPLDDGTLTDCDDNPVVLADGSRVRLAHDTLLDEASVRAWQQHLVDYAVQPLFQQLGKGRWTLPEALAQADALTEFEGHLLEAFALRGRAAKLGWTRAAAEDGGWFHAYEKRFPTLGLQAAIGFTGNSLPEENRTVALLDLSFQPTGGEMAAGPRGRLPLGRVPQVLLSECRHDLRLMAAEGSGFDADWKRKSAP